uniref:Amidase domain-containing protein n=1 Tax=Bionectria ochroleuca TaxID=29856 RepID=A0A8H7N1B3_BIOOC
MIDTHEKRDTNSKPRWEDVVAQKKKQQAEALAINIEPLPSSIAGSITALTSPDEITSKILSGQLTSHEIVRAFIQRAREAHEKTNCLTEVLFEEALNEAKKLDKYFSEHVKLVGPYHGVPITLKDQFNVKGYDSTIGYVGRSFKPAEEDAVVVKLLRSFGAIIIAKSNLPQSIMWCETENPLWGLTTNPSDKDYTPGGSTGGEGVLLALRASMLGWGTDIGGSIRIPSHMMGLYGLKPSSARLPYRGVPVSTDGQEHVPSSIGPMARDLRMIHAVTEALISAEPWRLDARCAALPWREDAFQEVQSRPLTIGVLYDDEVVRPHPPVARVLRTVVEALKAAGHEILEWDATLHPECVAVMDQYYTADGGKDIRDAVSEGGEPFIPHVERLINSGAAISVHDYWALNRSKWELQQNYMEKWDNIRSPKTGRVADVVILPPLPHTAVPHTACRWVGYTKIWNFLDYPALVLPAGNVKQDDIDEPWEFAPRNSKDEWTGKLWEDQRQKMADLRLPVGVQLVCRKLEEEKLLGIGKVVDEVIRESRAGPK